MSGQPTFFELGVADAGRARAFYPACSDGRWIPVPPARAPRSPPAVSTAGCTAVIPRRRRTCSSASTTSTRRSARVLELGGSVDDARPRGRRRLDRALRPLQALPRRPGLVVRPAPAAGGIDLVPRRPRRRRDRSARDRPRAGPSAGGRRSPRGSAAVRRAEEDEPGDDRHGHQEEHADDVAGEREHDRERRDDDAERDRERAVAPLQAADHRVLVAPGCCASRRSGRTRDRSRARRRTARGAPRTRTSR